MKDFLEFTVLPVTRLVEATHAFDMLLVALLIPCVVKGVIYMRKGQM